MIVVWQPPALRDLRRLDPPLARQVRNAVLRFAATGAGEGFRLVAPATIHVEHVLHRSQAYR